MLKALVAPFGAAVAVGLAAAATDKPGDRVVASCAIQKPGGIYYSVGLRVVGDQVSVVSGSGDATLLAVLTPTSRQLAGDCKGNRPLRRDLSGLAGPWPRRVPKLISMVYCSWEQLGSRVVLDFKRIRTKRGRLIGNSLVIAFGRRPLLRVTATRTGGGVWLDPAVCLRTVVKPPP